MGTFKSRKNIYNLQVAVRELSNDKNKRIKLHLVGGGGNDEARVLAEVEAFDNLFTYHGEIYNKEKLLEIYRKCDVFAMPSVGETFGLVYVEAMLQGLPILYTKNDGIDGFYSEKVGEAVSIGDVADIKGKLFLLYTNYKRYEVDILLLKNNHDWKLIAKEYLALYIKGQ